MSTLRLPSPLTGTTRGGDAFGRKCNRGAGYILSMRMEGGAASTICHRRSTVWLMTRTTAWRRLRGAQARTASRRVRSSPSYGRNSCVSMWLRPPRKRVHSRWRCSGHSRFLAAKQPKGCRAISAISYRNRCGASLGRTRPLHQRCSDSTAAGGARVSTVVADGISALSRSCLWRCVRSVFAMAGPSRWIMTSHVSKTRACSNNRRGQARASATSCLQLATPP